ncbi:MAG TPA: ABC transporter ATP-binding protein, partial [Polyangiaceae bacterium]|nr:ABC transporter ATP-binding protein [Polyangiaceae bacterium]
VTFQTEAGTVQAVDGVSFDIHAGETLALVGESGSGKSVTAMSILRLIESQRGRVQAGQIYFEGRDLLALPPAEVRAVRGNRIGMVFQEPMSSLNPVYTLGSQIGEPLQVHRGMSASQARAEAIHLLDLVNMPAAERRVDEYPHQLSGGMRQRAMIAMALACRPSLLIADEPTTALDVTVQAQILELIARLQSELGMSVLMITHDLGVVASVAHRAIVMYAGRVVEQADVLELFDDPRHPYTAGLFDSLPRIDVARGASARLRPIEGSVPDALDFPSGCRFHPRCRFAFEPCAANVPPLLSPPEATSGSARLSACWYTQQRPGRSYLVNAGPAAEMLGADTRSEPGGRP